MVPSSQADAVIRAVATALSAVGATKWAYVYGSVARGEAFRDVDVAVAVGPDDLASLVDVGELALAITRQVARETGLDVGVDIVVVDAVALPHLADILTDGRLVIDRNPEERRAWERDKWLRWLDFKPTWDRQLELRREALRERS